MPLHCTATRPNFLNVYFFSFSNPVACLDGILENRTYQFLMFFVFSRLLSNTLASTSHALISGYDICDNECRTNTPTLARSSWPLSVVYTRLQYVNMWPSKSACLFWACFFELKHWHGVADQVRIELTSTLSLIWILRRWCFEQKSTNSQFFAHCVVCELLHIQPIWTKGTNVSDSNLNRCTIRKTISDLNDMVSSDIY